MTNIYNLEPQAFGHIIFKTTFGDLDIELFTKQCPKATRNFIQLCLDGYYDGTIFDRVEKDFIAVGGTHENEPRQDDFEYFPDEFHPRLRFTRRGLLATANTKKDENGPKFFFTLGPAPELQGKHSIFGRVKGNSVYSLVDLNDCQVDADLRPESDQKITQVLVVENPIPDLAPRLNRVVNNQDDTASNSDSDDDPFIKPRPSTIKSKKLSFNYSDDDDEGQEERQVDSIEKKAYAAENEESICVESESNDADEASERLTKEEAYTMPANNERAGERERKLQEIKAQIQSIKRQIEGETESNTIAKRRKDATNSDKKPFSKQVNSPGHSERFSPKIASDRVKHRERETMELISNFKNKLKEAAKNSNSAMRTEPTDDRDIEDEWADLDKVDGGDWLKHKFEANDDVRLAKDVNTKDDSWYSIDDPRHRSNRRRDHRDRRK